MAYLVNILDSAIDDIAQLITYLQSRWGSDVAELAKAGFPNYRLLVHDKHTKILYQADEARQIIHVHIVFSSKQDFQTLLYHRIMRQA